MVQLCQPYASDEVFLVVSSSGFVPGGTVLSMEDYEEQVNIIQKILVAETLFTEFMHAKNLGAKRF